MAFLDNLGKKVSEAGQKTIQKTKEISDISRINGMISDEEKVINNTYFQIGKLYVSLYGDKAGEEFSGMIRAIADAEEKIEDYRKQIQDIKGIRRCEKCGAEVSKDAAFCSSCGAVMAKAQVTENADYMKCESCGATVKKGMRFCTTCGKPMETILDNGSTSFLDNEMKQPEEKICPNCGEKVKEELAFCTECGTKL